MTDLDFFSGSSINQKSYGERLEDGFTMMFPELTEDGDDFSGISQGSQPEL